MNKNCFVSWSGGKDSCLALYKAMEQGYSVKKLFTMFSMENNISSAHRLKENVIKAQALAMGVEHSIGKALFDDYEEIFIYNLKSFKEQGIDYGIFGDIDIDDHKKWEDKVCEKASITSVLPLWQRDRVDIVKEFLDLGFKAKIVVVNKTMIDVKFLGQDLSYSLMKEIQECGADPCGENGEYHTVVYDGPIFKHPVHLEYGEEIVPVGEHWAQIEVR
ncbi:diphthine--ammonia ligase [Clostridium sp. MSJ-11]|uniref:Diphthine--ammonia ligase n=1 Tax=Clostridium mobile TaxID=2841512 RepID=A0ABS6EFT2_9CLOT|nr:diphthine--ammonia ligase [Clostridium mobile]MBU5484084.1 diphthine--ammonia ligase [Clostridium mobile]